MTNETTKSDPTRASPTPRTDAEAFVIRSGDNRRQFQDGEYVRACIARQLEREVEYWSGRHTDMTAACETQVMRAEGAEARSALWAQAADTARAAAASERERTLEEAAKVCESRRHPDQDEWANWQAANCAAVLRNLKLVRAPTGEKDG